MSQRLDEALRVAAPLAWRLSAEHCQGCRAYHGLWPWLRLAGLKQGLQRDRALLLPLLSDLLGSGRRRLLVAGAADSGLADLAFDAAAGRPLELTVLDRCETPLALSRHLAARYGLPLQSQVADLLALDHPASADIILAHSVLAHLPAARQGNVLERLGQALAPQGRLVLVFRLAGRRDGEDDLAARLAAGLARQGMTPPDDPAFADCLSQHAIARGRQAPFPTLAAAEATIAAAGLRIERLVETDTASGGRAGYLAILSTGQ